MKQEVFSGLCESKEYEKEVHMARNKRFRNRILGTVFMTGMIAFFMIRSTAFAAESGLYEENDKDKADRTIMMYVCGSNIESDDGNA